MKKKLIIYSLVIIFIVSGVFIFVNKRRVKPIVVNTSIATNGEIKAYLSTTATIKSKNVNEYYGIQAKVNKVNVNVSDSVKKGEALVVYEISDLVNAVKQAQIQYSNTILQKNDLQNQNNTIKSNIANLNNQISILERSANIEDKVKAENLKQEKSSLIPISSEKLELADNSINLAKLALDAAKQRLSDNKGTIYASSNGVVTAVNVTAGTIGNAMQPAVEVQDLDNLKAVVSLGKYDADKIHLGQSAIITSGDKTYMGRVSAINPIATTALPQVGGDSSLLADIDILNKAPLLKVAFSADVDILIGQAENVVKVPAECLKVEGINKNLVYVLDGNVVHERAVKVGLRSDTDIEIRSGIKAGEVVILNPSASIAEGVIAKGE